MSDFNRPAHAVLKAATASGFFLMRWTGDFGPGPQFVMDNGMNAVIPQGDPQLRFDPALNLAVGSKALRTLERLVEFGKLIRSERGLFACGNVDREERWKAAGFVETQPCAHRGAIHPEDLGRLPAEPGLSTGKEVQQLDALALGMVPLLFEQSLKLIGGLRNGRDNFIDDHPPDASEQRVRNGTRIMMVVQA
jgi:hypothetical protein